MVAMIATLGGRVVFIDVRRTKSSALGESRVVGYVVRDMLTGLQIAPLYKQTAFSRISRASDWITIMQEIDAIGPKGLGEMPLRPSIDLPAKVDSKTPLTWRELLVARDRRLAEEAREGRAQQRRLELYADQLRRDRVRKL